MDPTLQWVLGLVFTASLAIVGGFLKYLFGVIKSHKQETQAALEKLERDVDKRREETRDHLLELINTKFNAIYESIQNLKDRIT